MPITVAVALTVEEQMEGLAICVNKAIEIQEKIAFQLQREWDDLCGQGRVYRADAMDGESPCLSLSLRINAAKDEISALKFRANELKAGVFKGLCKDCKNPISFKRLCSHPSAKECTDCGKKKTPVRVMGRHGVVLMVPQSAYAR